MDTLENAQNKITNVLKNIGLLDYMKESNELYCGGSLPMLTVSQKTTTDDILTILNDIDIYTSNIAKTLRNLNKVFGENIINIENKGINVNFNINVSETCKSVPIQLITSPFDSFCDEVLGEYDCDLVSVGYYPYKNEFIFNKRFTNGLQNRMFSVIYEKTYMSRLEKLILRAKYYFDSDIKIVKENATGNYRPYWKGSKELCNVSEVQLSPPYIQIYCNKYKCLLCKKIQERLLCETCSDITNINLLKFPNNFKIKNLLVFGGVNGLGKIIGNVAEKIDINVFRTGRKVPDSKQYFTFDLSTGNFSKELETQIEDSNCIIFNAYQTLEGEHSIWNTTIETFDKKLALERFTVNCFGYVKILEQLIQIRKNMIAKKKKVDDLIIIFMDANESKFDGKLQDGKHLELNMAKTACKQIFYTNAQKLAGYGVISVCYDPGWLSYHGISVDKIESKSKFLITPEMSSLILLKYIQSMNIDKLYDNKIFVHDTDVYSCIKKINILN